MISASRRTVLLWALLALLLSSLGVAAALQWQSPWADSVPDQASVLLLQPSQPNERDRWVLEAWRSAIAEEGFQTRPVDVNTVENSGLPGVQPRGVILPDTVLTKLSDKTVAELYRYVEAGGRLFVAFDAGSLRAEDGMYAPLRSRLSDLVGVTYAEYRDKREGIFRNGTLLMTPLGAQALAVQPGKTGRSTHVEQGADQTLELKAYGYDKLNYPMLTTRGPERGTALARSLQGDAVVLRSHYGKGEVLFVNMPVGYLKSRSDGYLLHQSLRLFLGGMLGAPQLLSVPDGVGGIVLNVHVDSGASNQPLRILENRGFFKDGPFSLHFTAGPDTYEIGDKSGLNIDNSVWVQNFIHRAEAAGHEIGDHGGWIHNIWGDKVNETNASTYESYLEKNHNSMTRVLGRAPKVYSAPVGNHPLWANRWLENKGFTAYYDTGGSGLGPMRGWREGKKIDAKMWAFPVANFKTIATFEEIESIANNDEYDIEILAYRNFTKEMIDYVSDQRVVRLTYFHTPAAERHATIVESWLTHAKPQRDKNRFRWYRMDDLAQFLTRREEAKWSWSGQVLRASHPKSLSSLTWILPNTQAQTLIVREGNASITQDGTSTLVQVKDGKVLVVGLR
jgi:Polysaccharide deacetylase